MENLATKEQHYIQNGASAESNQCLDLHVQTMGKHDSKRRNLDIQILNKLIQAEGIYIKSLTRINYTTALRVFPCRCKYAFAATSS